jgi:putative DNA primase/helicase
MRRRGASEAAILAALRAVNREQCRPPLDDAEVRKIAASVARYEPEREPVQKLTPQPDEPSRSYHLSDLGNAQRLVDLHGKDIRYCHPWGRWLVYGGRRWQIDESGKIIRLAKETVARIYAEAAAAEEDQRKALAKWALQSENERRIKAMVELANRAGHPGDAGGIHLQDPSPTGRRIRWWWPKHVTRYWLLWAARENRT